jgi:cysteinyl-tRNA synthetase
MGAREKFVLAMEDDFNTADAMGVVFELVRDINTFLRETRKEKDLRQVHALYMELISLMGFEKPAERGKIAEEEIEELIALRGLAKKEKNYALADEIRNNLKEKGVVLEDTAHGVKWRYEN